jgi:CTP:molybdopterin cytidylyltransferase MocA
MTGRPPPDRGHLGRAAGVAAAALPGSPETAAGLVLAAGAGTRMGRPKALLRYGGDLLLERACRLLTDAGCAPVLAVLGAGAEEVVRVARLPAGATTVNNPDWPSGMGSSLRVGLSTLPPGTAAVVVVLVDTPGIGAGAVHRLVAAWRGGAVAAQATYHGEPGHPVLLSGPILADVAETATGDCGAREWLRGHADLVARVACDSTGYSSDLDTPDDLAAARSAAGEE